MSNASNDSRHFTGDDQTNSPVPLLDLQRENQPLREQVLAAIAEVCDSGRFLHGPAVRKLEASTAAYCQVEHAISCASGSDALLLSLMAFDIGAGDEVITPSFTFFATASAVWRLGAKPVFVDIDPQTFNIDPQKLEEAITPATKAIIPVHLYGQCAEMDRICEIAQQHKLHVIEDAAQAIGAKYKNRPAGSLGELGCISYYPTKNLGGFGDGGMITTSSSELAEKLRMLADHGMKPRYFHSLVGINSRMDSIQAAVLDIKLAHLDKLNAKRRKNAARYLELFEAAGLSEKVVVPPTQPDGEHVWNQFTIRILGGVRDSLRQTLTESKVGSEIYYPTPLHLQECFRSLGYAEGSLPETERASSEVLCLPIFPELTEQEQQTVVQTIARFFACQQACAA